jgi:hypothetical protein
MLTLLKYGISLAIWAIVAVAFLIAGSPQMFAFWGLLGLIILIGWFYKMVYRHILSDYSIALLYHIHDNPHSRGGLCFRNANNPRHEQVGRNSG